MSIKTIYLATLLTSLLVSFPAMAAPTLSLGSASGLPGQAVNIPVTFTNDGTVVSLQFDVQYATSQLNAGMPTAGTALGSTHGLVSSEVTAGIRRIVVVPPSNNAVLGSGQIATIPFTIQSAATSGLVSLSLSNVVLSTASAGTVTPSLGNGQVTVAAISTTTMNGNSGPNPALVGQTVTLSALVSGGTGSMVPTGTVTFKDGTASLNTVALNSGTASMTTSSLVAGTHSITAEYSGDANNTASTSLAMSVVVVATSTGYFSPSANTPETSSAGDGNGYEGAPANAHGDDALSATDANSGTGTSTSCTNSGKDKHRYYNYNFTIPNGVLINGITVRLDAQADSTSGTPRICAQLSWNGGATWTTTKTTATLTTSMATYTLGGTADTWGRTWSPGDFSNANFRVRLIDIASNTSRRFTLDWVAVRADLGLPVAPAINSTAVTTAVVGNAYSYQATATGTSPITWSMVSGPSGMTVGASTGLVGGWTPAAAGLYPVQIRATNSAGSNDQSYTITVVAAGGPVAYWKLDESSGTTASDSSGYGRTGQVLNGATFVAGRVGSGALNLDGTNDYVSITGYKGITGTAARTVAAWIKTSTVGAIISWGSTATSSSAWTMRTNASSGTTLNTLRVEVEGGYIVGTKNVMDNQWHHVAATFANDGTPNVSDVKLYVDGVLETPGTISSIAINTASSADVRIGTNAFNSYFKGLVDDVRVYNRALTAAEIASLAGM